MNMARAIQDYAVLATVRRRRGQALEDALREAEAALKHAQTQVSHAESELGARLATMADYTEQLRARTAPQARVQLEALQAARGHSERLAQLCEQAQAALDAAHDGVRQARDACARVRRQIALNEDRIESLDDQRLRLVARRAREREEREDDERADTGVRRSGAPA